MNSLYFKRSTQNISQQVPEGYQSEAQAKSTFKKKDVSAKVDSNNKKTFRKKGSVLESTHN